MSPEIQPADPRLRLRFLLAMILIAAIGAAGILSLDDYLTRLHALVIARQTEAVAQAHRAIQAVLALIATGGTLLSVYLGSISWRALRSERFPPPGARVISDTRILHGAEARRRGQAGLALALLTLMATVVVVASAHRAFGRLLAIAATPVEQLDRPAPPRRPPLLPE